MDKECETIKYDNPLEPVADNSSDFIQVYESLDDIKNPMPYTIYSVGQVMYRYEDGEFIELCSGGSEYGDIEQLVNEINELVG